VKYVAPPLVHLPKVNRLLDSPIVVFELLDSVGEKIDLSVKEGDRNIQIMIPNSPSKGLEEQFLQCKWFDQESSTFKSDGCSLASFNSFSASEQISDCTDCSVFVYDYAMCLCSHLSTFAIMYSDTATGLGHNPDLGIYTDYFAMDYWQ